jgi:hypothetical protein
MNRCLHKYIFYLSIVFVHISSVQAQVTQTVTVKREDRPFLFFQKGHQSDTIVKSANDIFYLSVPDSLKEILTFVTENGQLVRTANDSLVQLKYLPGYRYLFEFESVSEPLAQQQRAPKKGEYKTLIDGVSGLASGKILLRITNKRTGKIVYETTYWYKL